MAAPFIEAATWRDPLRQALSDALGRPVEVRELRYRILPTPGLSAYDVVIPDDAAFGIEPLAYVTELQVGIRWWKLLMGRLEISSVSLVEASVNFTRRDDMGWNVVKLLNQMSPSPSRRATPPAVRLRQGRINFRAGLLKSPFFLNNVDLDMQPPDSPGAVLEWSYEASPARTDRAEQGFGRFTGDGRWEPSRGPRGSIEVHTELEPSTISEVLTLLAGRDLGLQGRLTSRARLDGPLNGIQIVGQVEFIDVQHSGLFGLRGRQFQMPFEGLLNLLEQKLELRTSEAKDSARAAPLGLTLSASSVLLDPRWRASMELRELPAAALLDFARRLGVLDVRGLSIEGAVNGAVVLVRDEPPEGSITLSRATLRMENAPALETEGAAVRFAQGEAKLETATWHSASGAEASVSGRSSMNGEDLTVEAKFHAAPLVELTAIASASPAQLPLVSGCQDGKAGGSLRYSSAAVAHWEGSLNLEDVKCAVEGVSAPVELRRASLSLRRNQWALRVVEGKWSRAGFVGSCEWDSTARRPLRFSAQAPQISAADVETLFAPTLRRARSLLDRTLPFRRSPLPGWLAGRHAQGEVSIGRVTNSLAELSAVRFRMYWDGANIEIPALEARVDDGAFSGLMRVSLAGAAPVYRVKGRLDSYRHSSYSFDAEFDLETSGMGEDVVNQARASGEFQVYGAIVEGAHLSPFRGSFDWAAQRGPQRLRLGGVEIGVDGETLVGSGAASADARLSLEAGSQKRTLRLTGTLSPFALEAQR